MAGLVPKSGFLQWLRPDVFPGKGKTVPKYSDAVIESDIQSRRKWMHHNFLKQGTVGTADETPKDLTGPVTRSSVDDDDKWMLDEDAFTMETTERRRLSRVR